MQFEIELENQGHTKIGNWFNDFVQLGVNLSRFSKLSSLKLDRILLSIPRKELVGIAISLGVSINKLLNKIFIAQEVRLNEFQNIPIDSLLRIHFSNGQIIDCKLTGFDKEKRILKILTFDGMTRRNYLDNVIDKILLLPPGCPLGTYSGLGKFEFDSKNMSIEDFFKIQLAPGLLFFTDRQNFELQIGGKLMHPSLDRFVRFTSSSIQKSIRMTNFFEHHNPFLVNTYAGTSDIERCIGDGFSRFKFFDWIVLDGNNSITRLAARDEMLDQKVLSLLEVGVPRSQSKALDSFSSVLNGYRAVDVCKVLNWKPPMGVNIWGWAR